MWQGWGGMAHSHMGLTKAAETQKPMFVKYDVKFYFSKDSLDLELTKSLEFKRRI